MLALLGNLLAIVVNLGVGGRILRAARGPERRTERLLGWALVWDGLEWLFWFLSVYTPLDGTTPGVVLGLLCRLGIVVASTYLLAFTRAVFHPEAPWALVYVALAITAMFLGMGVSVAMADWHGYQTDLPWVWLENTGVCLAYGWVVIAAGDYYRQAKRRLALQLGDPVVVNRILLWSAFGAAMLLAQLVYMFATVLGTVAGHYPLILDSIIGGFTVVACGFIWLAFFPPESYRRWLRPASPADS